MPLRDHFRPPLDDETSWDGLHGFWPSMIVLALQAHLPARYRAAPHVHLGSSIEVDVGTWDGQREDISSMTDGGDQGGGVATAVWAPPRPTLSVATDLPDLDEYEVRVYDTRRGRRLVAAVEIVSPANKDRPEHRRAFLAKCAALLLNRASVVIVNLVTVRSADLYGELLGQFGQADPSPAGVESLSASAIRSVFRDGAWWLETWAYPLALGGSLPTLPLWIASDRAVPLELDRSYEETCRVLRIP